MHAPLLHATSQVEAFCHEPDALHVCTVSGPLHCVWFGAQEPVHTPLTHVLLLQAVPTVHVPELLHVSGPLLLVQPTLPTVQTPVHTPLTHVVFESAHEAPLFCQLPLPLQFCGCWPLHCFWPATQLPEHTPPTHVELLQVTELPHVPAEVHVCTPLPEEEHCVAPGVHTPWQAPLTQA
jgi:hypothetical protein